MNIFHDKAEQHLLTYLAGLASGVNKGVRCFIIKLDEQKQHLIYHNELFENSIKSIFGDSNTNYFFCSDYELVIIPPTASLKEVEGFKAYMNNLLGLEFCDSNISILDIKHQINDVLNLVEEKLKKLNLQQKEANINEEQKQKIEEIAKQFAIINIEVPKKMIDLLPQKRGATKAIKVLIVEDDMFASTLLRSILKKDKSFNRDYEIESAVNAEEAIREYFRFAPDITFMDINLPDASGHDIVKKITPLDDENCIIMLSGNTDKASVLKAIEYGAKGDIAKPFTLQKLVENIGKCNKVSR